MNGIMVAIEGLDIVGKTTVAQNLSKKIGWHYYKTPPKAYYDDCVKLGADGIPTFSDERFWLFIECLKFSSLEISELLTAGKSVAVDRWLWTTLAYHFAFNSELESKWQEVAHQEISSLINPHLSLLVHVADEEIYKKRKTSRKSLTAHDKMVVNNSQKSEAILKNFKRLNPHFIFIDNSGDLVSTMDIIMSHVDTTKKTN